MVLCFELCNPKHRTTVYLYRLNFHEMSLFCFSAAFCWNEKTEFAVDIGSHFSAYKRSSHTRGSLQNEEQTCIPYIYHGTGLCTLTNPFQRGKTLSCQNSAVFTNIKQVTSWTGQRNSVAAHLRRRKKKG